MKKLFANIIGVFGSSFLAAWSAGVPPKEAAVAAGMATLANIVGLYQQKPSTSAQVVEVK